MIAYAHRCGSDRSESPHIRVSIFAGPDDEHRALAGTLMFRDEEYREFYNAWTQHFELLWGG